MNTRTATSPLFAALFVALMINSTAWAQPRGGPQGPQVISPEVSADGQVTFRILGPKAEAVRLSAGDIPGVGQGKEMTKGTNGVWEVTLGPIDPGAYRYNFNVVYKETDGGHTWINWRNYLYEFAPPLFR